MIKQYDIKVYRPDGREGPTVRELTYAQQHALTDALNLYNIKHSVKECSVLWGFPIGDSKEEDSGKKTL